MKYEQAGGREWTRLLSACVGYGLDAMVILLYIAIVDVLLLEVSLGTAARAALGLPLVVFLPGYAITAAAFPRTARASTPGEYRAPLADATRGALTPLERVALSFGTSVAVLPLLGVALAASDLGYSEGTLLGSVTALVVLALLVGVARRLQTAPEDRLTFAPGAWLTRAKRSLDRRSRVDVLLTVGLVGLVLVSTSSLGFALLAPQDGESYTTLELLTENESGDLVTGGYPTNYTVGDSRPVVLGIGNHEDERTTYTVVTELQRINRTGGTAEVVEERELARHSYTLDANETRYERLAVEPTMAGDDLRLVYLLYRGEPPDDPRVDNAYRYVHIWISVEAR